MDLNKGRVIKCRDGWFNQPEIAQALKPVESLQQEDSPPPTKISSSFKPAAHRLLKLWNQLKQY